MNASAQVDFIGHVDGPVYDWRESIVLRASFVFVLILWAYNRVVSSDLEKFLLSHPLVGYPRGQWLKSTRASFKSILGTSRLAAEGYKTYSKNDKPFILPILLDKFCSILPPSLLRELLDKSDHDVNDRQAHKEQLQSRYTFPKGILEDDFHFDMIRKQLTRNISSVASDLAEELRAAFEEYWPNSTEWTTVAIYPLIRRTVARSANRVFAGVELCRSEIFLERSRQYSQGVFAGALLINCVPHILRPIVAPLMMLPNRRNFNACLKVCRPVIEQRIKATRQYREKGAYKHYQLPNDFLQWLIEKSLDRNDPSYLDPAQITGRLLSLNMVAIHTSSIVATNVVLDLFSSPNAQEYLSELREEIRHTKPQAEECWTRERIGRLASVDSAIRETMRVSTNEDYVCLRVVTAPQGVSFSNGMQAPHGAYLAVPSRSMHLDSANYSDPLTWDAFRIRQLVNEKSPNDPELGTVARQAYQASPSLVTWTENFLGFGAGKHTCPGRFFAANELKLLIAYLLDEYDVEFLKRRPPNMNIIGAWLPSENLKVRVRLHEQHGVC